MHPYDEMGTSPFGVERNIMQTQFEGLSPKYLLNIVKRVKNGKAELTVTDQKSLRRHDD